MVINVICQKLGFNNKYIFTFNAFLFIHLSPLINIHNFIRRT